MAELHLEPSAWVILANHYHLLVHVHQRHGLGQLVKLLHGRTSHQINQLDNAQGRQLWYSYWDRCIRSDHDFWTRFNYIHYNPVKHGYVENPEDWEYSSYSFYIREQGQEWLAKAWLDYPADTLMQEDKY
jgi:putative transposase